MGSGFLLSGIGMKSLYQMLSQVTPVCMGAAPSAVTLTLQPCSLLGQPQQGLKWDPVLVLLCANAPSPAAPWQFMEGRSFLEGPRAKPLVPAAAVPAPARAALPGRASHLTKKLRVQQVALSDLDL